MEGSEFGNDTNLSYVIRRQCFKTGGFLGKTTYRTFSFLGEQSGCVSTITPQKLAVNRSDNHALRSFVANHAKSAVDARSGL